ncbi:MAG: hypothetical protein IT529_10230 [Burkholderiales bacterium]|nr:hypothetical protein [Burkholderiales bacterium]
MLALPALAACGGIADEFLPNTERGRLEVSVARAVNTNPDNVTVSVTNERLRFARGMLARTLPPGIEVHVDVSASGFGTYRFGGGWITNGDLYLGRHAVPTETIEVVSSDVRVLAVGIVPDPTSPGRQQVKPITLKPGTVRLTFNTSKVDKKRQRIGTRIEDSLVLTASESPGRDVSPASAKPGK